MNRDQKYMKNKVAEMRQEVIALDEDIKLVKSDIARNTLHEYRDNLIRTIAEFKGYSLRVFDDSVYYSIFGERKPIGFINCIDKREIAFRTIVETRQLAISGLLKDEHIEYIKKIKEVNSIPDYMWEGAEMEIATMSDSVVSVYFKVYEGNIRVFKELYEKR